MSDEPVTDDVVVENEYEKTEQHQTTFSDNDSFFEACNDISILTKTQPEGGIPNFANTQTTLYPNLELSQIAAEQKHDLVSNNEHTSIVEGLNDKKNEQIHNIDSNSVETSAGLVSTIAEGGHSSKNNLFHDVTETTMTNEEIKMKSKPPLGLSENITKAFTRYTDNSDVKSADDDLFTPSSRYPCKKINRSSTESEDNRNNSTNGLFVRQQSFNARSNISSPSASKIPAYQHPFYTKFDPATKKYFQLLQRYHLADTLPVYFRAEIQMQLRSIGADLLTIGLFGPSGVGKSAFLNSVYTTINGEYVEYSAERKVNRDVNSSSTDSRLELRLTETITLLDNRATDFSKDSLAEISKQCEGYREAGMIVPGDWNSSFKQTLKDYFTSCSEKKLFRNRIFCPVIVDSVERDMDSPKYKELIETIKKACGYSPIIVLTHKDKVKGKEDDIITTRMREFEQLNCNRLFVLTNYTYNAHANDIQTDEVVIQMLFNCCLVADQELKMLMKRLNSACCKC